MLSSLPDNEAQRLALLQSLNVLDTPPEAEFDRIADLAKALARSEVALLSLVDQDRQWFKAARGVDVRETPRDISFCAHAIGRDEVLWVEDAAADPRFHDNPVVLGGPKVRFYAGAPIIMAGACIGTVCVLDSRPRPFDPDLARRLADLARMAADRLELRLSHQTVEHVSRESAAAHRTMSLLVRSATNPLVMTDVNLEVIDVSDRWIESYGRTREAVIGRSMHQIFPATREQWDPVYQRCLAGARERGERAVSTEGAGGVRRWFQWDVAPWRDAEGRVAGLLLTNHDVTDLVHAREAAERAGAEIARARDAAEAANRAKDEFLANMSHEVRTPLNGVLGVAGALALSGLDPAQAEMVRTIEGSGRELERMLTGVLELVRLGGDGAESLCEPVDLVRVLEETQAAGRAQARAKGLDLRIVRTGEGPAVAMGDETRIRDILGRLLDNALKFTEAGSIRLGLELRPAGNGVRACFTVEDTGVGFDPADAERLFDRFHQADGSSTRRFGGSGLGLAVCRALAAGMGGTLEARSEPGRGSVFTLALDLQVPATRAAAA